MLSSLKKIWVLAIVFMALAAICLFWKEGELRDKLRGLLVFAHGEDVISQASTIRLKFPSNNVTLYKDKGYWRVLEANNYYADTKAVNLLHQEIKTASRGAKTDKPIEDVLWAELSLSDKQDKLLETVQISDSPSTQEHYVRYSDDGDIYTSSWKIKLPPMPNAWTYQPLLTLNGVDINSIQKEDKIISRQEEGAVFYDSATNLPYQNNEYLKVFTCLSNLNYDSVLSSQEFDVEKYRNIRTFNLTTFDGLKMTFDVYTDYNQYWLQIGLGTTSLPRQEVDSYVATHRFLYDGWWFGLPEEVGRILFSFTL